MSRIAGMRLPVSKIHVTMKSFRPRLDLAACKFNGASVPSSLISLNHAPWVGKGTSRPSLMRCTSRLRKTDRNNPHTGSGNPTCPGVISTRRTISPFSKVKLSPGTRHMPNNWCSGTSSRFSSQERLPEGERKLAAQAVKISNRPRTGGSPTQGRLG